MPSFLPVQRTAEQQLAIIGYKVDNVPKNNDSFFESIARQKYTTAYKLRKMLQDMTFQSNREIRDKHNFARNLGTAKMWNSEWIPQIMQLLDECGIRVVIYRDHKLPTANTILIDMVLDACCVHIVETESGHFNGARSTLHYSTNWLVGEMNEQVYGSGKY